MNIEDQDNLPTPGGPDLPDEEAKVALSLERREVQFWSGPLPHPQVLQGYSEVLPDAPDRIFKMAESLTASRVECRTRALDIEADTVRRAQWLAFFITMSIVVGSFILVGMGKTVGGGIAVIITALASLVLAFFGGHYLRSRGQRRLEPEGESPPDTAQDESEPPSPEDGQLS